MISLPGARAIIVGVLLLLAAVAPQIVDLAAFPGPARLVVEGGLQQDQAGGALATGDLNDDGIPDLIVGARYADPGGRTNAGAVYVVYGGSSLPSSVFLGTSFTGPRLLGASAFDQFGGALAVGDFNGDSIDDLMVGASWADPAGRAEAGCAYLFLGQSGAFPSVDLASQQASVTVWGAAAGVRAGMAVAAGDLNADGRSEMIVGAPRDTPTGSAFIIPGASAPPLTVDLATGTNAYRIEGSMNGDEFGAALATGHVNSDERSDLAVGAPGASPNGQASAGAAYVIYGSATLGSRNLAHQPADFTIMGPAANDGAGSRLALGDLNHDGFADITIGAPTATRHAATSAGAVFGVLLGPTRAAVIDLAVTAADLTVVGDHAYDKLGTAVLVEDLDRDGYADVIVGAPDADPPGRDQAGLSHILSGRQATSPGGQIGLPDLLVYGAQAGDRAGTEIAVGALLGDGAPALVIGAPRADSFLGADAGRAYVLAGPFRLTPYTQQQYLPLLLRIG